MAAAAISQGAIRAVFENGPSSVEDPILQCVQIKAMESKDGGPDRYRVVLSDISNFIQSMLATQTNHVVTSGQLKKGSIIRLKQYNPQIVKGKKIFILIELDVLSEYGEPEKIGEPVSLDPKAEPQDEKPQPNAISGSNFYGNRPAQPQPQQQQQQPSRSLPSHSRSSVQDSSIYPIESISPYNHRWTIKARCTHKGAIKTWHNKNGPGKLFSINLLDDSGEIRATAFNDACDALFDLFQEGGVYYISSPCGVRLAKKQFSNVNHDYELTFEKDTVVEKAEDQDSVPQVRFNFTGIGELESIEKDTTIETIGILKEVGEVSEIISKTTSKPFSKRDLTLVDDSLKSVRLTVWGNTATDFDTPLESVIAFKGVKVSDFGGRSLSLLSSGSMTVDPDIDEAHKLKGWYDAQGRQDQFTSHAQSAGSSSGPSRQDYKTIKQVQDENIGMNSDVAEYFSLKATIIYVKQDNFAYPACSSDNCNRKVIEMEPGEWRCEKCDKSWPKPNYRYILSCNVSDHSGQMWLSCFDETAQRIMKMDANAMHELKENDETAAVEAFSEATCRSFMFRVKAKMDSFDGQQRVRHQVVNIYDIDFSRECSRLADILKQYNMHGDSLFV